MKILFLCGSLEPGKDGVGDYTRRMASALIRFNHQATIVALNDPYIDMVVYESQVEDKITIPVMRLTASGSWKQKLPIAKQYISKQNPDWISLQYVPFAFHHKGVPYFLTAVIKKLVVGKKFHIMFHELWTGMKVGTSTKELLLGILQKGMIFSMIRSLSPAIIHTQSHIYLEQLKRRGIEVKHLPLFGNIAVIKQVNFESKDKAIRLICFGGIQAEAPVEQLIDKLQHFKKSVEKAVIISFVGRSGPWLNSWLTKLKQSEIGYEIIGEQTPEKISGLLQQADVGIFTTPAALAEKSGSVAAMLEHGLPVICVQHRWVARGLKPIEIKLPVYELSEVDFRQFFTKANHQQSNISLKSVATQFLNSLGY